MTDQVEERVLSIFREKFSKPDLTIDSSFEELGIDSLDTIEALFEVEEEFGISIPDDAARSLNTFREVVAGVEKLRAGKLRAEKGAANPSEVAGFDSADEGR